MRRIKVVSEPTDLVPLLRAFDTEVKRGVFHRISESAAPVSEVERAFGPEGVEALNFFEKTKLATAAWTSAGGKPEKAYQSAYTSFQLGISVSAPELTEIMAAALMPEAEFLRFEQEIEALVGQEGYSARAITDKFGIPLVRLKALLKRSSRLDFRGHLVKKVE